MDFIVNENYGHHYLDKKDFTAVLEVLSSKNLQGKFVETFEKYLINYFGSNMPVQFQMRPQVVFII